MVNWVAASCNQGQLFSASGVIHDSQQKISKWWLVIDHVSFVLGFREGEVQSSPMNFNFEVYNTIEVLLLKLLLTMVESKIKITCPKDRKDPPMEGWTNLHDAGVFWSSK